MPEVAEALQWKLSRKATYTTGTVFLTAPSTMRLVKLSAKITQP
jgi:hypothetical protein